MSTVRPPEQRLERCARVRQLLRDPWYAGLATITSTALSAVHRYFDGIGYRGCLLPVTTSAVSSPVAPGSDSLPLSVTIGDQTAYLADSQQFLLELALRLTQGHGAYYVMPSFRGDEVDPRHLSQFFHVEAELSGSLDDAMSVVEGVIGAMCVALCDDPEPILRAAGDTDHLKAFSGTPLPRVEHTQATDMLGLPEGGHIGPDAEARLSDLVGGPFWLRHLPADQVPFYQAVNGSGESITADLILGGVEVAGVGTRAETVTELRANAARQQVDLASYEWYLELKRESPVLSSGFGIGFERFVTWALQHDDIRDCTLLLRDDSRKLHYP